MCINISLGLIHVIPVPRNSGAHFQIEEGECHRVSVYTNTLLLLFGWSQLLQGRDRVFACSSNDLDSIPGWGR